MHFVKTYLIVVIFALAFQSKGQESSIQVLSWNVFLRPSIMNDGQMDRVSEIGNYLKTSGACPKELNVIVVIATIESSNFFILNCLKRFY